MLFSFTVGASNLQSEQRDKGQSALPEDTEMAIDALDASCIVNSTTQDTAGVKGQSQDKTKGQLGSCSVVKGIRFTLPNTFEVFL